MNSFAVILSFYCCWFTTSSSIWTWEFEAILFPSSSFAMIAHRIVTSERGGQGMPSLPSRKLTGRHEALRSWIIDRFDNRHPHHRRYTGVLCQPLPPPPNSPPTSLWPLKAPPPSSSLLCLHDLSRLDTHSAVPGFVCSGLHTALTVTFLCSHSDITQVSHRQ